MLVSPRKATLLINSGLVLFTSLLLLWPALHNGYPFVHSDTGAYVNSSFTLKVSANQKPIGYGLFLMSARPFQSLWVPVFFQSLITALLLFGVANQILPAVRMRSLFAFGLVALTVLTTDVCGYVSLIMPDILGSWLFLGGLLFLISNRFTERIFSVFAISFSFIAHNSHPFLSGFSIILLLFFSWIFRSKNSVLWKNSKLLSLIILIAALSLSTANWILKKDFTLTNSNSLFYINKLAYHGVLRKTLDKYCPEAGWKLCNYREVIRLKGKEHFPNWYFWGKDSPVHEMERATQSQIREEYDDIIAHSLKSFFPLIVRSSLSESWKQLTRFKAAHNPPKYDQKKYAVVWSIERHYPNEFSEFMNGKQQLEKTPRVRILPSRSTIYHLFFLAAAMVLSVVCLSRKYYLLCGVLLSLLSFLILNATVVGFTVAVETRYQGRIFWLIPFFVFLVLSALLIRQTDDERKTQIHSSRKISQ